MLTWLSLSSYFLIYLYLLRFIFIFHGKVALVHSFFLLLCKVEQRSLDTQQLFTRFTIKAGSWFFFKAPYPFLTWGDFELWNLHCEKELFLGDDSIRVFSIELFVSSDHLNIGMTELRNVISFTQSKSFKPNLTPWKCINRNKFNTYIE